MQSTHVEEPSSSPNLPAGQFLHSDSSPPEFFPTGLLYLPAPQSVHGADPVNTLYFPATHAVQLKSGPDVPGQQAQVVKDTIPTSGKPGGAGVQRS